MSESQSPAAEPAKEETYLDTVIGCITERNQARVPIEDATINSLFGQAGNIIKELDNGISVCRKYN